MLSKLLLQNFQSHKHSELDLDPGVNVIIGSSDSGKTAIIRALRWLVWNRPLGNEFQSDWGGATSVSVITNTGEQVIRGQQENGTNKEYFVYPSPGSNAFHLTAFGTDVPKEVSEVVNIDEVNLQSQLDSPFLLTESPGTVAQYFNKIAKLDKIDTGLQNVQKWIKELSKDIEYKNVQLTEQNTELKKYDNLDKIEIAVEVLENQEKQLTNKQNQRKQLAKLITNIVAIEERITFVSRIIICEPILTKIFDLREDIKIKEKERNKLFDLVFDINTIHVQIKTKQKLIVFKPDIDFILDNITLQKNKIIDRAQLNKLMKSINRTNDNIQSNDKLISYTESIEALIENYKTLSIYQSDKKRLSKLITLINNINFDIKTANSNVASLNSMFVKEMGDVCILCGTKLKKYNLVEKNDPKS
jgi:DNA repair ATPase RecN